MTGWRGRWRRARAWAEVGLPGLLRGLRHRFTTGRRAATPTSPSRPGSAAPLVIDVEPTVEPVLGDHEQPEHSERHDHGRWLR